MVMMEERRSKFQWKAIGESIRGDSHIRNSKPNQDNFYAPPNNNGSEWIVAAVSDGHGSKVNFRSHLGAQIAVNLLNFELRGFLSQLQSGVSLSLIKRTLEEKLPQQISRKWEQCVERHLMNDPFTEEELEKLTENDRERINKKSAVAYGATLLGTIIAPDFVAFIQLGDGEIVIIDQDSSVRRPIEKDQRFIANETSSLCSDNAWAEINVQFQAVEYEPPQLIMMCSDGYSNSFKSDDEFLTAIKDFYVILKEEGSVYINNNLNSWLEDASRKGSGDDTTMVLLYSNREEILESGRVK